MPNRGRHRSHCKGCGRHRSECGRLSARGRCVDCGRGAMERNAEQLAAHDGAYFDHWRERCAAAFGAILYDDPRYTGRPGRYAPPDGD